MYTIRYNGKKNHIAGIAEATTGSEMNYPLSACPALSSYAMAEGPTSESLIEILDKARIWNQKPICMFCEKAAQRELAERVAKAEALDVKVIEAPVIEVETDEIFEAMKARAVKMGWTITDAALLEIKGDCTNRAYAIWKLGKAFTK